MGIAATCEALFRGYTTIWDGLPPAVGLILFFGLMSAIGLLEGMQIAFFTVSNIPKSERGDSSLALETCHCLFKNGGKNLPGFMCGRQITVTLCFFIIARVTTINVPITEDGADNIFGVANWVQKMFNLGFMGAITTTILGSVAWQLVASSFPIAFLSNPIVFVFLQAALFLEATGVCAAAWFLALLQKKVMGYQYDEVYVGTPEERAAKDHADDNEAQMHLDMGTNVLAPGINDAVGFNSNWAEGDYTDRLNRTLQNIAELRLQINLCVTEEEKEAFQMALKLEVQQLERTNKEQEKSVRNMGGETSKGEYE